MDLFDSTDIDRMTLEGDREGLIRLLDHPHETIRMEAAMALAELNEELGWQFLMNLVVDDEDPEKQMMAAAMLGDLGEARAVPALKKALRNASGDPANVIKEALEAIGGEEAADALRSAGYEPVAPQLTGDMQSLDFGRDFVRSVMPNTSEVKFLSAQEHLDQAVELREAELAERALVEDSLALWLSPEMAYGWYLRGVLFEDLDRYYEAALCYRWALELDSNLKEAREAADDLDRQFGQPSADENQLLYDLVAHRYTLIPRPLDSVRWAMFGESLASSDWKIRRDAAAGLGDIGEDAPSEAVDALIELLDDTEREVRHAVIEALGNIGDQRAVAPLAQMDESSWLLRFAVIEALSQLGAVEALALVLRREMNSLQKRNPVFSRNKDPLLEGEYERLMEIGVLAFERTGDLEALLTLAEGNEWVEVDEEEDLDEPAEAVEDESPVDEALDDEELEEDEFDEDEEDEELASYVDEVAVMSGLALERLALPSLSDLDVATLQRLAAVPDLTLYAVSNEEGGEERLTVIQDHASLREAAKAVLARR